MMILDSAVKLLQIVLGGVVVSNQLAFTASYIDINSNTSTMGSSDGVTNNTSLITLIPAPAYSTQRQVKSIFIQNSDTATVKLFIIYNDNGNSRNIFVATLNAGDNLVYEDAYGFAVFDSTGTLK